jgi:hypothetical protein
MRTSAEEIMPAGEPSGAFVTTDYDTSTIDALIDAFYESISGPAGERDWERQRSLFTAGARLYAITALDGSERFEAMSLEEYAESRGPFFRNNSFYEVEVGRREERWTSLAVVYSTYEGRHQPEDAPFLSGLNVLQLVKLDGRWRIASVIWKHESASDPLPARYRRA